MGNLDRIQQALLDATGDQTTLVRATVILPPGATGYQISLNGNIIQASALDDVSASPGDSVLVAVTGSARGQAEAFILGRLSTTGLHPATGTVTTVPPSSPTITVLGADGVSYTAYFLAGYTPAVNDNVEMAFLAGYAYVTSTGATPAPTSAPAPVASGATTVTTGTNSYAASDSSTYGPYGWDSWDLNFPSAAFQGAYGGGSDLTGAWFYGGAPGQLQGRTITGGRVTLGPRLGVGSYNSPETVHIWTHSSPTRPGGNVSLVNGPTTVTAQPWQGLTTYPLTAAQAQDLVNGGGIALSFGGGPYVGFQGVRQNAQSGTVSIDWSRS